MLREQIDPAIVVHRHSNIIVVVARSEFVVSGHTVLEEHALFALGFSQHISSIGLVILAKPVDPIVLRCKFVL